MSGKLVGKVLRKQVDIKGVNVKLLLVALAEHCHGDDPTCYPGIDTLAWEMQCSERCVSDILAKLEKKEIVTREQKSAGPGHPAVFKLHMDKLADLPRKDEPQFRLSERKRMKSEAGKGRSRKQNMGEVGDTNGRSRKQISPSSPYRNRFNREVQPEERTGKQKQEPAPPLRALEKQTATPTPTPKSKPDSARKLSAPELRKQENHDAIVQVFGENSEFGSTMEKIATRSVNGVITIDVAEMWNEELGDEPPELVYQAAIACMAEIEKSKGARFFPRPEEVRAQVAKITKPQQESVAEFFAWQDTEPQLRKLAKSVGHDLAAGEIKSWKKPVKSAAKEHGQRRIAEALHRYSGGNPGEFPRPKDIVELVETISREEEQERKPAAAAATASRSSARAVLVQ